jgi:hypothetical protein
MRCRFDFAQGPEPVVRQLTANRSVTTLNFMGELLVLTSLGPISLGVQQLLLEKT